MASGRVATDFENIINAGRDRKKNEALAARIFNRDRRASGGPRARGGGSLASRAGVNKRIVSATTSPRGGFQPRTAAGDINGEWTHDLHDRHSAPSTPRASPRPGSLASRITGPGAAPAPNARRQQQQQRRAEQVSRALTKTGQQINNPPAAAPAGGSFSRGMVIRGLAGPYVVMAQNFAPGTTAADIENAMTPVAGLISSCRLLKVNPIVIAEIVIESKEGADNVVSTFNNQTADGRLLHVYHKPGAAAGGPPTAPAAALSAHPPSGPRAQRGRDARDAAVVDGTLGFDDPMDGGGDGAYVNGNGNGNANNNDGGGDRTPGRGLYSDSIVRPGRGGGGGGGGGTRGWTRW
ncbi:hypothetical protein QBC33DRAFT_377512 [Phialemonium atrogriseum]|uniref:RRM domain-containing protein n=1 Tax=Phialemonium atrogriseum TaxID=1093897 RepID=A0AAJ0C3K3_9PEZI|nr:uncharacterized protein QBC33DRAFT_377512 [Phialemonium atrogriseum]KAK1768453.1 hypothetical protein QBC33DRAFT_377512 [Phialemonium atrogriseum]